MLEGSIQTNFVLALRAIVQVPWATTSKHMQRAVSSKQNLNLDRCDAGCLAMG